MVRNKRDGPCSCTTGPSFSDESVAWGQNRQVRRDQILRSCFGGERSPIGAMAFAVDLKMRMLYGSIAVRCWTGTPGPCN